MGIKAKSEPQIAILHRKRDLLTLAGFFKSKEYRMGQVAVVYDDARLACREEEGGRFDNMVGAPENRISDCNAIMP